LDLENLSYKIRSAIFEVFKELGPGLLESVYEIALLKELVLLGIQAKSQVVVPVFYKGEYLESGFRIDILVENKIIIEIKSIKELEDVHKKQLLTYLKLSELQLGFLVNFNTNLIQDKVSLFRIVNNYQQ
jgi:GxxExxY protein